MRDEGYAPEEVGVYGSTEQPAVAARMAPHLRITQVGAGCALLAVAAAALALVTYPSYAGGSGGTPWAVTTLAAAVAMLAICVLQVAVWLRALASWRGLRPQDLRTERQVSWVAHLASYGVALIGVLAAMAGIAYAGWAAAASGLLVAALLGLLAGQVLAGVQYLRPDGPPGTVPAHMRRLVARNARRADAEAEALSREAGPSGEDPSREAAGPGEPPRT